MEEKFFEILGRYTYDLFIKQQELQVRMNQLENFQEEINRLTEACQLLEEENQKYRRDTSIEAPIGDEGCC